MKTFYYAIFIIVRQSLKWREYLVNYVRKIPKKSEKATKCYFLASAFMLNLIQF